MFDYAARRCAATAFFSVMFVAAASAGPVTLAKDSGPSSACDRHAKNSTAWTACISQAKAGTSSDDLFYAGYWLARTGEYEKALGYLTLADNNDPRVVTYIGFATRKLGDVEGAMPHYRRALKLNPDYSVARAYMGEAFLEKNEPAKAKQQLNEIANRCGTSCAEYRDLAQHISAFEKRTG